MSYALGVDLGTTYTAAATFRDGRVEIADLGTRSAAIPSVVLLREDEEILTGEAASRRGATEPGRVAREFKRRVGDTTPILLGGSPYSAEQLMARLLSWVNEAVAEREGGTPEHLAISHPANWGNYKKDLLSQAVRLAGLPDATFLTEPEAAAVHYASQSRVDSGNVIAVYDLGGGTFDAAVLRKTTAGFEILGQPEGVERLGGIDFDAAVFAHVARSLGGRFEELDEDDPTVLAAVARLRQECVHAKEALSGDTDVSIPVLLPNVQTDVRLTRSELESMIRPVLGDSIAAMRRALDSAAIQPGAVTTVLLVGGSSRIPLVGQMVGSELGRPVSVDAHPKHAIALGAALAVAQAGGMSGAADMVPEDAGSDDISGAAAAGAGVGAAAGIAAADKVPEVAGSGGVSGAADKVPEVGGSGGLSAAADVVPEVAGSGGVSGAAAVGAGVGAAAGAAEVPGAAGQHRAMAPAAAPKKSKAPWILAGLGVAVLLIAAGLLLGGALGGDDADGVDTAAAPATTAPTGTLVRHDNGTFEVRVPDGWQTETDYTSENFGTPGIQAAPDLAAFTAGESPVVANGFTLFDLTGRFTPEEFFVELGPNDKSSCINFDAPEEPFTVGELTGLVRKVGPCSDEGASGGSGPYEGRYLIAAVTAPDGSVISVGGNANDQATEDAIVAALESFTRL